MGHHQDTLMLTPKLQAALLAAFHAPAVTLNRCNGGFFDRGRGPVPLDVITRRTAQALVDGGMAVFDDATVPSCITLTPDGIQLARDASKAAA